MNIDWINGASPLCLSTRTRITAAPLAEGLQMYTALVDRGVPARLCCFHGENHELSRSGKPQHRVRRLKEITDWIEKYTK